MKPLTLIKSMAAFVLSNTGCSSLALFLCHQPPVPRRSHPLAILPSTSNTLLWVFLTKCPTEWRKERHAKSFLCLGGASRKVPLADVTMRSSQNQASACSQPNPVQTEKWRYLTAAERQVNTVFTTVPLFGNKLPSSPMPSLIKGLDKGAEHPPSPDLCQQRATVHIVLYWLHPVASGGPTGPGYRRGFI